MLSDRIAILIENDKIKYVADRINDIQSNFSSEIFGEFLIKKIKDFLSDDQNTIEINNDVGTYLLKSSLTLGQKINFLNKYISGITEDGFAKGFASEICFYYAEAGVKSDDDLDLIDEALGKTDVWINKIRVVNSINLSLGYDKERVSEMLTKLGDEYSKLNIKRNRPRLDNNSENLTLISFLNENNHISSYEVLTYSINAVSNYQ